MGSAGIVVTGAGGGRLLEPEGVAAEEFSAMGSRLGILDAVPEAGPRSAARRAFSSSSDMRRA